MGYHIEAGTTTVGADPGTLITVTTQPAWDQDDFYLIVKNNAGVGGASAYICQSTTENGPNGLECPAGGAVTILGPFDYDQVSSLYLWSSGSPSCVIQVANGTGPVPFHYAVTADPAATAGSAIKEFTETVLYSDLSDADTSEDYALTGFPANVFILWAWIELTQVFAGGTVNACTASVGDAGAATQLVLASNVFTGASLGRIVSHGALVDNENAPFEAAYAPIVQVVTTAGNIDTLTTGSLTVHIYYVEAELAL